MLIKRAEGSLSRLPANTVLCVCASGIVEAFDEMGLTLGSQSAQDDMEELQFMFRDSIPADEARERHQQRERARKAKREGMSKEEKEAAKIKSWPTELIFFMRTSELLQGLGSKLNVRHQYMSVMAAAARKGLRDAVRVMGSRGGVCGSVTA